MAQLTRTIDHSTVNATLSSTYVHATPHILLAEDNVVNQKLASLLFKKLGCALTVVSNGKQAVEHALQNDYDLILMDVFMPEMDGMEATQLLKKNLGERCPHIVALTANTMNGDRERMLQAGMDDYLPKPLDMGKLKDLVQRYSLL